MTITLNGKPHETGSADTVSALLESIGLGGRPVVVEINRQALLQREHSTQALKPGDVLEIVQITAGG